MDDLFGKETAPLVVEHPEAAEQNESDKRDFNPVYPNSNTQPARLLAALLQRRRIHPLAGWRALGIYRLSDTVYQLREMGWPVITGRLDVNNRFGEACHVALYSLPADAIESAGSKGAEYVADAEAERQAA